MEDSHKDFLAVLGHCFLQCGQYERARVVFEGMVALFPDDTRALASLGYVLGRLDQPAAALEAIERLDRLPLTAADQIFSRLLRGRALWALGRHDEARRIAAPDAGEAGSWPS